MTDAMTLEEHDPRVVRSLRRVPLLDIEKPLLLRLMGGARGWPAATLA